MVCAVRTALLGTCRVSRQIVWEVWKNDVAAIAITTTSGLVDFTEVQKRTRDLVIEVLNDRIE